MKKISVFKTIGIILSTFLGLNSHAQSIMSTLDGSTAVVAGMPTDFEVSTISGTKTGSTVKIFITLSDTNLNSSVHLAYYNPQILDYDTINFVSGVAQFGPPTGFLFFDATSDFRVVFDSATTYDYTLEVLDSTATTIASASESVTVNAFTASTISSDLNGQIGLLQSIQNDFTIYTTGGNDTSKMVWVNMKLSDSTLASHIQLSYFDGFTYQPLFFGTNGETRIGTISGINLQDDSIQMRVIFDSATSYNYILEIEEILTNQILSSANESVTIDAYTASSIKSTLNGRVGLATGNLDTFSINVSAGSLANELVILKSYLADSNLANYMHLEYFDGVNYQALSYGTDGSLVLEPTTGFSLADTTVELRVSFDSAATYDFTFKIINLSDTNVIAESNESVSVGQTIPSVILSTLNGRTGLTTNIADTFTVSVISGSAINENVTLKAQLVDSTLANYVHLEYFDGTTYQPLTFNSDGSVIFGPATGFPLADATTEFRIMFDSATTYDYSFQIVKLSDSSMLAVTNESVSVNQYISPKISSTLNARMGLKVGVQDTFSVSTTAGSDSSRLVLISLQLANANLYDKVHLEYFDGTVFQPIAFSTGGTLIFGTSGGFPLKDATTDFKVIFDTATTYDYELSIVDAITSDILITTNESVTIENIYVAPTVSTTLNGRTSVFTNTSVSFIADITANSDSAKSVQLKITLLDAGLNDHIDLNFFNGSTFVNLPFINGVATYGTTGFSLATQKITFLIEFDTATTVNYKVEIIELSSGNILASSTESVMVNKSTTGGVNITNKIDFAIMPNPANDFVTIDYDNNAKINIYDITGKLLKTTNINDNKSISISEFKNGTYYIQVVDGNYMSTKKLVIIH